MGREKTMRKIPNILHFVWVGSKPPKWVTDIIMLWHDINPGFQIMFHRSGGAVMLDKYLPFYSHMKMTCNKVDVQKWCILQRFGGWVMDTDTVPLRSFTDYLNTVPEDREFVAVEFSKNRERLDMGWIGATTNSAVWPIMDEFLVDMKGVDFKRPNQGGHGAINYAYQKAPELFHVEKREIYCPYSRHDKPMRKLGLEFFQALQQGKDLSHFINRYYAYYNFAAYGWHLWANGRDVLT